MHGPSSNHNPLHAAAKQAQAVARETKSPWFEKVAIWTMVASALTAAVTGMVQAWHLIRRDLKDDCRERERERHRTAAAPQPPGGSDHFDIATAGERGGGGTRRADHEQASAHARKR